MKKTSVLVLCATLLFFCEISLAHSVPKRCFVHGYNFCIPKMLERLRDGDYKRIFTLRKRQTHRYQQMQRTGTPRLEALYKVLDNKQRKHFYVLRSLSKGGDPNSVIAKLKKQQAEEAAAKDAQQGVESNTETEHHHGHGAHHKHHDEPDTHEVKQTEPAEQGSVVKAEVSPQGEKSHNFASSVTSEEENEEILKRVIVRMTREDEEKKSSEEGPVTSDAEEKSIKPTSDDDPTSRTESPSVSVDANSKRQPGVVKVPGSIKSEGEKQEVNEKPAVVVEQKPVVEKRRIRIKSNDAGVFYSGDM